MLGIGASIIYTRQARQDTRHKSTIDHTMQEIAEVYPNFVRLFWKGRAKADVSPVLKSREVGYIRGAGDELLIK